MQVREVKICVDQFKVQRHELSKKGALLAARLLQGAEIELVPTRSLLEAAARIAIELDHRAYDCYISRWLSRTTANSSPLTNAYYESLVRDGEAGFGIG